MGGELWKKICWGGSGNFDFDRGGGGVVLWNGMSIFLGWVREFWGKIA